MRFVDPKTDFAFKRIFGSEDSKAALISFINASLELAGDRLVETVEIKNPYQTRDLPIDKHSIVDIACTDKSGIRYLVEMQVDNVKGFANRMLFNLAGCYSGQLIKGQDYPKLNDVVLISVMDFSLFEGLESWRSLYVLKDIKTNYAPFNQFRLCCLELKKFDKTEERLAGMLDKWAFFLKETGNLEMRPDALRDAVFDVAFEKAEVSKLSPEEKEAYDASIQKVRDERGKIAAGVDKGRKEGRKEGEKIGMEKGRKEGKKIGLEKGRKEGREEERREMALGMLEKGMDIATISEISKLTLEQVKALKKQ